MAQQEINLGTSADDQTGDSLRAAGAKINDNFSELYADKQPQSAKLDAISAATPIADGPHTAGGITITTVGGIITAIS